MLKNCKALLMSMLVVFKHLFMRPVTLEYPETQKEPSENFRGKPIVEGCIKCETCIKVCPTRAITINNDCFEIDLKKCIFCGNCSFYCPVKAIKMSKDYELATNDAKQLKLTYKIEEDKA